MGSGATHDVLAEQALGMSDDKTEQPTPHKLKQAKEKGQQAKSQDVNVAIVMMGMVGCLMGLSGWALDQLRVLLDRTFQAMVRAPAQGMAAAAEPTSLWPDIVAVVTPGLLISALFVVTSAVLGLVAAFAQVGVSISFEPISPDFNKVNPGEGLKKLISVKSFVEFVKMLLKAAALTWVVYLAIKGLIPLLIATVYQSPAGVAQLGWDSVIEVLKWGLLVLMVLGPVDYGLQLWLFLRDQRMSKDEVKRETKDTNGNPEIKGKRRELGRELAESGPPEKSVPGASVVVTNPTHYAVALRYDAQTSPVPVVVAKGVDAQALAIRRIAEAHRIPIVGNPPLARALYTVKLSDPVPEVLFEAVAAVLRWVQFLNAMKVQVVPGDVQEAMPAKHKKQTP